MASLETNLNQSPYFDDFNEEKNFHRVLFRPGYAVQARELTQLQSILQNQVERFGDEILDNGTVINGCDVELQTWGYVKLRDKDANNRSVLLTDFFESGALANGVVEGSTTGVTARLLDAAEGSEGADPNFLSVFVSYTNSGANNTTKSFANNETLIFRQAIGNTFIVAANTITTGATGNGLGAVSDSGVVYHKGHFIRSARQHAVVSKYSTTPNIRVGFETQETIIDSNKDSSLLDNASGATNFSAPGAARLKIEPKLKAKLFTDANTAAFFPIADVQDGLVIRDYSDTRYGELGIEMARRTFEESGHYSLRHFDVRAQEHLRSSVNEGIYSSTESGDKDKFVYEVTPGAAYVNGFRTEIVNTARPAVSKATTTEVKEDVLIGQAFGSYLICDDVMGTWDIAGIRKVDLYNAAQNAVADSDHGNFTPAGTKIGEAHIRGFQYHSGISGSDSGQFRIYIFNVKMNSGKEFSAVRSLYINNVAGGDASADVVLQSGEAKLTDPELTSAVFPIQSSGVKTLKDASNNVQTKFVFRAMKQISVGTSGTATGIAANTHSGGTQKHNDTGSPLSSVDERNVILVSREAKQTTNFAGTASQSGSTVTGSGTSFQTHYKIGQFIKIGTADHNLITGIGSQTAMTVKDSRTVGSATHARYIPQGNIFDLSGSGFGTLTSADGSTMEVDLQLTFSTGSMAADMYFDVIRSAAVPEKKTVLKDKFIHINTASHSNSKNGTYSLGVSDAFKLVAVYQGSNTGVTTSGNVITEQFMLDNGQKDTHYDTSRLVQRPTSNYDLTNKGLLVQFSYFDRDRSGTNGIGFTTVDSYTVDDSNPDGASNITTQEIPIFKSKDGALDLRDCVDFRPAMANAVTPSASGTVAAAPTNPGVGTSFNVDSDGSYLPSPDKNFQCHVQKYLPRFDKVTMRQDGTVNVVAGTPEEYPSVPPAELNEMILATVWVPPYPSLSPTAAAFYERPGYEIKIHEHDNRRFTMKALRKLEKEVQFHQEMIELNRAEIVALKQSSLRATDSDSAEEPPKDSIFIDPAPAGVIENTLRPGNFNLQEQPLKPVPKLNDISLQLQTGYANVAVSENQVTLAHTGYGNYLSQTFATKHRTVSVESSRSAKLYNGTMKLPHRICAVSQVPHTIEQPVALKLPQGQSSKALSSIVLDYGNASPGIDQWEHGYAYMQNQWMLGFY
jgi:hypothetical protein